MVTDVTDESPTTASVEWDAEAMRTEATAEELINLFPPGTRTDGDGTLVVGGCRLDDVAAEFGTPAVVVAEDALRNRQGATCSRFRSLAPTATRCPTSTTALAGCPWCSPATARRDWWSAATPGATY
jgi:diaminopimelate decarboxylase